MKKIFTLLSFAILSLTIITSCKDTQGIDEARINFVSFETTDYDFGVEIGGQSTEAISVYSSVVSKSDQTIEIEVVADETTADAASYTIPTSVVIPAGSNTGVISIAIADLNIGETGKKIVLKFKPATGRYTGDNITLNVAQKCPNNGIKVKLTLGFDNWPEEASWWITASDNTVVMVGSPNHIAYSGEYAGMTGSIDVSECLASGTYTLNVNDDYADGGTDYEIFANGVSIGTISGASYGGSATLNFSI